MGFPVYTTFVDVTEDLFDKVFAVNLQGPFRLCSLAGTRMADQGRGSMINISSIAAVQPGANEVPYTVAKAGLNNLGTALADAFGPTVRVNTIMPGLFRTGIAQSWDPDRTASVTSELIPLRRTGEASEITGAALYLASDHSSYTPGAVIKVDGGMTWAAG
jgi:NAD(P)-dependent dehydrogenase (short-subunit alcohol dehydrogenase family)